MGLVQNRQWQLAKKTKNPKTQKPKQNNQLHSMHLILFLCGLNVFSQQASWDVASFVSLEDAAHANILGCHYSGESNKTHSAPVMLEHPGTSLKCMKPICQVGLPGAGSHGSTLENSAQVAHAHSAQVAHAHSAQVAHAHSAQVAHAHSAQVAHAHSAQVAHAHSAQVAHSANSAQVAHAADFFIPNFRK